MALVTLVKCAAYGLMNINELDLITVKVDIYTWDSYSKVQYMSYLIDQTVEAN